MAHVAAINFKGGLKDISGYNHPLEPIGNPLFSAGKFDQGLACFEGNAFRIYWYPGSYYADTSGGKSFQFYVKADPGPAGVTRVLYHRNNYKVFLDDGTGHVGVTLVGVHQTSTADVRDGQWHHILYCWNRVPKEPDVADTHRVWVDGVLVSEVVRAVSYTESTDEWGHFGVNESGGEPVNAILSDIKVWNDPVYPDEVNYFRDTPVSDAQRGLFAFDSFAQGKLRDASQHRNHLVSTGGTVVPGHHGNALLLATEGTYAYTPGPMDRICMLMWIRTTDRTQVGNIISLHTPSGVKFSLSHVGDGALRGFCVRDSGSTGSTTTTNTISPLANGVWTPVVIQAWASDLQVNVNDDAANSGGGSVTKPINMPSFTGINEMRIGAGIEIDNLRIISNWMGATSHERIRSQALVEPMLPGFYGKGGVPLTARLKTATGFLDLRPSGVEVITPPDPPTNFEAVDITHEEFRLTWTPPDVPQDNVDPSVPTGLEATGITHEQFTLGWQEATDG